MGDAPAVVVTSERVAFAYDAGLPPVVTVDPGDVLQVACVDARAGEFAAQAAGASFELTRPPPAGSNPLTGPIAVRGARPGDGLAVEILGIELDGLGWVGAHAHVNALAAGRIGRSRARACAVTPRGVEFAQGVDLPLRAMVGCIGTAPEGQAPAAGARGPFGGNLDHAVVAQGALVYLPVAVADALLYVGDLHAAQGDGELSGVAVEIAGSVRIRVDLIAQAGLQWPWLVTRDRIAVMTSGSFETARTCALEEMVSLVELRLGLEAADALALISAVGDLRIGQACGGMDLTLRLEMPCLRGLEVGGTAETNEEVQT